MKHDIYILMYMYLPILPGRKTSARRKHADTEYLGIKDNWGKIVPGNKGYLEIKHLEIKHLEIKNLDIKYLEIKTPGNRE